MASFFRFQPLPKRYIQGGGQKNLLNHKIELNQCPTSVQVFVYVHCYRISVMKFFFLLLVIDVMVSDVIHVLPFLCCCMISWVI